MFQIKDDGVKNPFLESVKYHDKLGPNKLREFDDQQKLFIDAYTMQFLKAAFAKKSYFYTGSYTYPPCTLGVLF